jgi:hypothetical protein
MQIKPRLYPHPVLAWFSDDYKEKIFQPSFNIEGNRGFYKISMLCRTSSKSLRQLISEGRAAYALHVECTTTRYRGMFTSANESFEIDIPVSDIDGKVEACRLIVATTEINNYASEEFHSDFTGRSFNLLKGDTLAVAEDITFFADKKEDELARLPSIFAIQKNLNVKAETIDIDLSKERITISLSSTAHSQFLSLNSDPLLRSTLCSTLLFPTLIYTLGVLAKKEDRESLSELRWYRSLSRRLKELGIQVESLDNDSTENAVVLANRLIGDVLASSMEELNRFVEGTEI